MRVDVGTLANPRASSDSNSIVSVSGTTVVFGSSFTSVNGDFISREDNNAASSVSKEITGLQQLIATSANTVGGIDASLAANAHWDNLRTNIGGAVSLSKLMEDSNRVNAKGARSDEVSVMTTPGITRRLFETADFKNAVRFVDSKRLKGGFESLSFSAGAGNYELVADRLHPWGKIHFVHKKHIKVFSPGGWDFLSRDGLTIRWVSDKDAFQAVLFRYLNLGTGRRNTSLVQYGVTDSGY